MKEKFKVIYRLIQEKNISFEEAYTLLEDYLVDKDTYPDLMKVFPPQYGPYSIPYWEYKDGDYIMKQNGDVFANPYKPVDMQFVYTTNTTENLPKK